MKTDSVEFTTQKSLQEISNLLRRSTSQLRADLEQINDPIGNFDNSEPQIAVVFTGHNSRFGGPRCWGVQVYVSDTGNARHVELVALGDGMAAKMSGGIALYLGDGIKRRNKIEDLLR